jgi:hypothetical protein
MTIAVMAICESQNCLCLRAANWTGKEDCANLAHFAAALASVVGFSSGVLVDDNERLVSMDEHLFARHGGNWLLAGGGETLVVCAKVRLLANPDFHWRRFAKPSRGS